MRKPWRLDYDHPQGEVQQLVFFATHAVGSRYWDFRGARPGVDTWLLRHYAKSFPSYARLWALQYKQHLAGLTYDERLSKVIGAGAASWGDHAVLQAFPLLARVVNVTSTWPRFPGEAAPPSDVNLRRYYWFHTSLIVWNASFGALYPNASYWWRVELDVIAFPSWGAVLEQHRHQVQDVLLPKVISYTQHVQYPHWKSNMRFLGQVSEEQWVYSLVSVGRYSQRFMRYMRSRWELGEAWYEEIWLPTACLKMGDFVAPVESSRVLAAVS
ncbi:hypothetical protein AB1Y20_001124 [Prymnesium parvum]|uniref:Protein xylosyltransferase n=1 Tax=Prymnesium parvum TaxID=97485 RepID=A0AB34K8L8_PRYPA